MIDWPAWLIAMATTTSEPEQENEKADWKVIMKHPSNSEGQSSETMWDHARMCLWTCANTVSRAMSNLQNPAGKHRCGQRPHTHTHPHTHAKEVYAFILSWMELKRTVNHVQWRSVKGIGICITISMWWKMTKMKWTGVTDAEPEKADRRIWTTWIGKIVA